MAESWNGFMLCVSYPTAILLLPACCPCSFLDPRLDSPVLGILIVVAEAPANFEHFASHAIRHFCSDGHGFVAVFQSVADFAPRMRFIGLLLDQTLPASSQISKYLLGVDGLSKGDANLLSDAGQEAWERSTLVHDLLTTIDKDGYDVGHGLALKDESRDSPFEVAQRLVWMLMDPAFRKDMHPTVCPVLICGRRRKGISTIGGVGKDTGGEGI